MHISKNQLLDKDWFNDLGTMISEDRPKFSRTLNVKPYVIKRFLVFLKKQWKYSNNVNTQVFS